MDVIMSAKNKTEHLDVLSSDKIDSAALPNKQQNTLLSSFLASTSNRTTLLSFTSSAVI